MTISSTANKIIFQGNGSTGPPGTPFTWSSFPGAAVSDLSVIYTDTNGNQTTLATNLYTIALNAAPPGSLWGVGGTLTYPLTGGAIATGTTLTLLRTLPLTQPTTINNQSQFYAQAVEQAIDQLEMQIQQLSELFGRAIVGNVADATGPAALPPIAQRANKSAAFDSNGNLVAVSAITSGTVVSAAMIPVVTAATLALGRTAFGLGAAATEGLGGLIVDVGGNLGITSGGTGITTGMLQPFPPNTLLGNNTGATSDPVTLTTAQVLSMLSITTVNTPFFAGGCSLSNDGGASTTTIDISAGTMCSDDFSTMMTIAAFKKTTSAWAVNSGNGGLDAGTISSSTWYHWYIIERTDTGNVDVLFSKSATSPTLPSNYNKKRRIGSTKTDGSSHWLAFVQFGNGTARDYLWTSQFTDQNAAAVNTSTTPLTLASVPSGISVAAKMNFGVYNTANICAVTVWSGLTLGPPLQTNFAMAVLNKPAVQYLTEIFTDTSQRINAQSNSLSTTCTIDTIGWRDYI